MMSEIAKDNVWKVKLKTDTKTKKIETNQQQQQQQRKHSKLIIRIVIESTKIQLYNSELGSLTEIYLILQKIQLCLCNLRSFPIWGKKIKQNNNK